MEEASPIQSSATAKAKTVSSSAARICRRSRGFCRSALGRDTLVGIVTFGSLSGSMLPFVLQRFGFD
ncbi:hypothetical protein QYY82_16730, partial [Xanthomonas campestris pv. campestris]|uniref:hypothetical protein n=1 Tax=Xanthomonas campestris TaxID=339 RepID=UPI002AD32716